MQLTAESTLPIDADAAALIGRAWVPAVQGPSPVVIRPDGVYDVSASFPTVSALLELDDPVAAIGAVEGTRLGSVDELLANTPRDERDPSAPWLLAPMDLQAVKAAGVTFAVSMLERVIEERTRGDADAAAGMRQTILSRVGSDLRSLQPGSEQAAKLKTYLIDEGLWSQYLEVGIGPDAELFTKMPVLSAIGTGGQVGVLAKSTWNNPEPEVVLAIDSTGRIKGATLGNDVNLRDIEGRSALLLGKAKDNNASGSFGPFIRLFDGSFTLDSVRALTVSLSVRGADDGFVMDASSHMREISRDPAILVEQLIGQHHQYPDGVMLMLGTMFAPIDDRDQPGLGFTHHTGDIVTVSAPELGSLTNQVRSSEECDPWVFGIGALMRNLAGRCLV